MMLHGIQVSPFLRIKHVVAQALVSLYGSVYGPPKYSASSFPPLLAMLSMKMSASLSVISSNFKKKAIPFYTPFFITAKAPKPTLLLSSATPNKPNLVSLVAHSLLVNDQSDYPPEFPRQPDYSPPPVPPEVPELPNIPEIETTPPEVETQPPNIPEVPTPGPDYPVPSPPNPTPPDIPLPPPGMPRPPPPDQLPPRLPPDPDILPPPIHPPPDILPPPEIKPPPGPFLLKDGTRWECGGWKLSRIPLLKYLVFRFCK